MNREIKFRIWDKLTNTFIHNAFIRENEIILEAIGEDGHLDGYFTLDNKGDYILQQFTGLKDKNGKEIYEGDIVQIIVPSNYMESNLKLKGEIVYQASYFMINTLMPFYIGDKPNYVPQFKDCEVIGNIFENSELIKNE